MADTNILRKVVWSHKVIYTSTGRPAKYYQLIVNLPGPTLFNTRKSQEKPPPVSTCQPGQRQDLV